MNGITGRLRLYCLRSMARVVGRNLRLQPDLRAVFLDDLISNEIRLRGVYEKRELSCLARFLFDPPPPKGKFHGFWKLGEKLESKGFFFQSLFIGDSVFNHTPVVLCVGCR